MKEYEVAITVTDVTSVDASSEEEAKQLAWDIFKENGYDMFDAELDVIGEYELDIIATYDMEE